jgi:hypothetical protein
VGSLLKHVNDGPDSEGSMVLEGGRIEVGIVQDDFAQEEMPKSIVSSCKQYGDGLPHLMQPYISVTHG